MSQRFWSVLGNSQKLDGGAMFGNAPKALWSRWHQPDEQNRIDLACRALLLKEPNGRTIMLETGVGAFFPPDLRERYGVNEAGHVLLESLEQIGLSHEQIDVVVLSHLHFDHAGGLLEEYGASQEKSLLFPNAKFVVGKDAFERAKQPHSRDRASFIEELPRLLEASGRLELVAGDQSQTLGPDFRMHFSEGHTPGLMLTEIGTPLGPLVFAGDLMPGASWMHLPISMGYDRFPERIIDEKQQLLEDLLARGGALFFTHDPKIAVAEVTRNEKGRFSPGRCLDSMDGRKLEWKE